MTSAWDSASGHQLPHATHRAKTGYEQPDKTLVDEMSKGEHYGYYNSIGQTYQNLRSKRSLLYLLAAAICITLFVRSSTTGSPTATRTLQPLSPATHQSKPTAQLLYVVVPAVEVHDADLCKTVITAQILNYPPPNLVEYGTSENGKVLSKEKQTEAKLRALNKWFARLPHAADDGIVILLPGPYSWFQLRPEVLLQRYYRITRRANQFTSERSRSVVFAAHDQCVLSSTEDSSSCVTSNRAYLSDSVIMGPAKDLRALLKRAGAKARDQRFSDVAAIFDRIFGEQEMSRKATNSAGVGSDFGIELDIDHELGLVATLDLAKGDSVVWRSSKRLSAEIQDSMPPFWTASGTEADLPLSSGWEDIELLTITEPADPTVPAMIHHLPIEGERSGESLRRIWWPRLWLQRYARTLYTAYAFMPTTVVATVMDNEGKFQRYWSAEREREKTGMVNNTADMDHRFVPWGMFCRDEPQWKEVFRDDRGPWHSPHYL